MLTQMRLCLLTTVDADSEADLNLLDSETVDAVGCTCCADLAVS